MRMYRGKKRHGADESEFLGQRGEDEIRVLFGQEVEAALRALHEAAPGPSPRAERDLALRDVIARAQRVGGGVEERVDAPVLVVLQHLPRRAARCQDGGHGTHAGRDHADEIGPVNAREEQDGTATQQQKQGRAQIRLAER
jgi:hypothetical protein